jgi:hypothetical protein
MASVKFEGGAIKGNAKAANILMHIDGTQQNRERVKAAKERNGEICHIDATKSKYNFTIDANNNIGKMTYSEAYNKYKSRLMEIEASPLCTNYRKDRTTMVCLEIPTPEALQGENKRQDRQKWFICVCDILRDMYGVNNEIMASIHEDETHTYIDAKTGENRTSKEHLHYCFIPEVQGQLSGNLCMKRGKIKKCNAEIEKMTVQQFNCHFHTGTKARSRETVQELKAQSKAREEEAKARQRLEKLQHDADILEAKNKDLLKSIAARRNDWQEGGEALDDLQAEIDAKTAELERLEELRQKYPQDIEEAKKGLFLAQKEYKIAAEDYKAKLDKLSAAHSDFEAFLMYEDDRTAPNGANYGAFIRNEYKQYKNFVANKHAEIARHQKEAERRAQETAEVLEQLPDRKKALAAKKAAMQEQQAAFFARITDARQQAQADCQKQ